MYVVAILAYFAVNLPWFAFREDRLLLRISPYSVHLYLALLFCWVAMAVLLARCKFRNLLALVGPSFVILLWAGYPIVGYILVVALRGHG
jgi:hypothetical protein